MYTRTEIAEMLVAESVFHSGGDERAKQRLIDLLMETDTDLLISEFGKHTGIVLEPLGFQDMFRIAKTYVYRSVNPVNELCFWH